MRILAASALLALAGTVDAGPRVSPAYSVATDTTNSAGRRSQSALYSNEGSLGGVGGVSTAASPVAVAKHGFQGQAYEVTALQIAASPTTLNETATRQLGGSQLLDDLSVLAVPAASISWSILSGPISGISSGGLATAGVVAQDTAATVQGAFEGRTGVLGLTVLDTIADNFGSYAGDGLSDAWQVQFFGQNNPNAAPGLDPDGDGHTNDFEFTAGLVPTSIASRFIVSQAAVVGQPLQRQIQFAPTFADRTYKVESSSDLASWPVTVSGPSPGTGAPITVLDTGAGTRRFYRVVITKP